VAILLLVAAVAAIYDARSRRVPNWLTYSAMVFGVVHGGPWALLACTLALLLLPLVVGDDGNWVGWGGGDVKLLGGLAALDPVVGLLVAVAVLSSPVPRLRWPMAVGALSWACLFSVGT
jgi:Flp pilus assembly protein protease CpaA